ncbi:MAG: hypothetical protein KDI46_04305 [Alphaproteobacteria bacterium]|nr:hypothetical protein [Alphaproteobacteria bacterium]
MKQSPDCTGGSACMKKHELTRSIIKLCHGVSEGRDFYAFVAIESQDLPYFNENYCAGAHSRFEPFGVEILRGWGQTPPEGVIEYLRREYGIEFFKDDEMLMKMSRDVAGHLHVDSALTLLDTGPSTPDLTGFPLTFPRRFVEKSKKQAGF